MLIDFHVHCFNPKIAARAIAALQERADIPPLTNGLIEDTVKRFDEWGVDRGVLLPIATKPTQQRVLNDWCAEQDGGRFISFGSVHPDAEDLCEELDRIVALGLHGIKLHPDYQGYMIDDERVDFMYDEIEKRGLPVVFHAGFDVVSPALVHCPPERSLKMLKKHPRMKVILAHMGGNDSHQQVLDLLAGIDGEVYFDTAFTGRYLTDELMEKIIRKHGADRILFASDCPWDSPAVIREKILRLGISDDDKEKIFSANALRLLGQGI
ncbi:amidohydrolase family protein [Ruminococcus sp.]|uniref:amidohydrolase family protein n=1 Tax=Ruminococcus sp. TaxID=41978 RepID=UPI0025E41DD6|nr:amidohydrolase family protein [Ruminococcus sp.]MBQ8966175.1 amidohydrolase family protein [Ruminococcus sp.]